jgi:hypothetical protein
MPRFPGPSARSPRPSPSPRKPGNPNPEDLNERWSPPVSPMPPSGPPSEADVTTVFPRTGQRHGTSVDLQPGPSAPSRRRRPPTTCPPHPWCLRGDSHVMPESELQAFQACEVIVCSSGRGAPQTTHDDDVRPKCLNVRFGHFRSAATRAPGRAALAQGHGQGSRPRLLVHRWPAGQDPAGAVSPSARAEARYAPPQQS